MKRYHFLALLKLYLLILVSLKGGFHEKKTFFFVLISNNTFMGIDFRKTIEKILQKY